MKWSGVQKGGARLSDRPVNPQAGGRRVLPRLKPAGPGHGRPGPAFGGCYHEQEAEANPLAHSGQRRAAGSGGPPSVGGLVPAVRLFGPPYAVIGWDVLWRAARNISMVRSLMKTF